MDFTTITQTVTMCEHNWQSFMEHVIMIKWQLSVQCTVYPTEDASTSFQCTKLALPSSVDDIIWIQSLHSSDQGMDQGMDPQ